MATTSSTSSSSSSEHQNPHRWIAPSDGDRRSPCPMVNALANHGYLPRNGLSINLEDLVKAAGEAVNLDPAATKIVGKKALEASTTGDAETFNLDDLNKHGVIEHDGSLSRNDVDLGDNHTFNPEIWASVKSHFNNPCSISIADAAKARAARLKAAEKANPSFKFTFSDTNSSLIESALYLTVMADGKGGAKKEWVETLFEQERLHDEFKKPDTPITVAKLLFMSGRVLVSSFLGF